MRFTKKTILIGTAAAVGVAAIGGTAVAATGVVGAGGQGKAHEEFQQELAQKLGVPEADVAKAMEEMHGERLGGRVQELVDNGALTAEQGAAIEQQIQNGQVDEAMTALRAAMLDSALAQLVQDGSLTQAQADEAKALAAEGVPIGIRGMKHDKDGDRPEPTAEQMAGHLEHMQSEGRLTAEQVKEIQALADAGKIDEAEQKIHALMDAARLAELVQAGTITQAQADRVQALVDAGAPIGIGGPGGKGKGHGGPGMGHGGEGHGGKRHGGEGHGGGMGGGFGGHQDGGAQPTGLAFEGA